MLLGSSDGLSTSMAPSAHAGLALDPVPLLWAVLCGALIGLEREFHGRPAGVRTHALVCLTSALLLWTSHQVPEPFLENSGIARVVLDPNRLGAGILTGIGFLGAASVIRAGDIVRGITTGATIWCTAGLGVVIGQGQYGIALAATAVVLLVLSGMDRLTRYIRPVIYRRVTVRGERAALPRLAESTRAILARRGIRLQDLSGTRGAAEASFELVFHVRCRNLLQAPDMLEEIADQPGVHSVEWSQLAH